MHSLVPQNNLETGEQGAPIGVIDTQSCIESNSFRSLEGSPFSDNVFHVHVPYTFLFICARWTSSCCYWSYRDASRVGNLGGVTALLFCTLFMDAIQLLHSSRYILHTSSCALLLQTRCTLYLQLRYNHW